MSANDRNQNSNSHSNSFAHIGIGDNDNTLIKVYNKAFGDGFDSTPGGQQILSQTKPLKLIMQLTVDGVFEVFSSLNPFVPLIKTIFIADVQPSAFVPIKYIAFTSPSKSLAHFVYDVDEDVILKRPTQELWPLNIVQHPLLVTRDYPIGFSKLCKFEENHKLLIFQRMIQQIKLIFLFLYSRRIVFQDYFQQIRTTSEGNETTWLKLSNLNGVRPKGYLIRVPFYLNATRESIVLFTEYDNLNPYNNAYELCEYFFFFFFEFDTLDIFDAKIAFILFSVIGGGSNTRVLIRKRINGGELAVAYWPRILSVSSPKKFVFEVALSGEINLYSEDNPLVPLLTAFDPKPFSINYLTYRTVYKQDSTFYISDIPLDSPQQIRDHLLQKYFITATLHPLLQNWELLAPKITQKSKCFFIVVVVVVERIFYFSISLTNSI